MTPFWQQIYLRSLEAALRAIDQWYDLGAKNRKHFLYCKCRGIVSYDHIMETYYKRESLLRQLS